MRFRELNCVGRGNTTGGAKAHGRHRLTEPSAFRLGLWRQTDEGLSGSLTGDLRDVTALLSLDLLQSKDNNSYLP